MDRGDGRLRELAGYNVRRANNAMQAKLMKLLAPFSLRRETFSALTVIRDNPGLRQADMAHHIAIDRPHAVLIVNELVEAGLVRSNRSEKDRRAYELYITDKGKKLNSEAMAEIQRYEKFLIEGVSAKDRDEFIRLLNIFETNAERFEKGKMDDR